MEVIINQIKKEVPESITLLELLQVELKGNFRGIAVAVNQQVVPRHEWNQFKVQSGQHILIIKATQGG